nr:CBBY-like protein [Tanacetum cinerariifolium]
PSSFIARQVSFRSLNSKSSNALIHERSKSGSFKCLAADVVPSALLFDCDGVLVDTEKDANDTTTAANGTTTTTLHQLQPLYQHEALERYNKMKGNAPKRLNDLLVVSGSGPPVTSNWAVCCILNPLVLPSIPPEGVKVSGGTRT